MKEFAGLVFFWLVAIYCFTNSYHAFRFPEKHSKARWTILRGSVGGIVSAIGGVFFLFLGCLLLADLVS
jgi:4-amino-4-deoxy-L-arabinose transferase-like glycosyltransferase